MLEIVFLDDAVILVLDVNVPLEALHASSTPSPASLALFNVVVVLNCEGSQLAHVAALRGCIHSRHVYRVGPLEMWILIPSELKF